MVQFGAYSKRQWMENNISNMLWPFWVFYDAFWPYKCTCRSQHLINNVFHEYFDDFMVCYIDNIFNFTNNMKDHEHHVHFILDKFKEIALYNKLEKCEFHQIELKLLGCIIFKDRICMDPYKVQTKYCGLGYLGFYLWFSMFVYIRQLLSTFYCTLFHDNGPSHLDSKRSTFCLGSWNFLLVFEGFFMAAQLLIHMDPSKPFVLETIFLTLY
jgi:hypothetical protein